MVLRQPIAFIGAEIQNEESSTRRYSLNSGGETSAWKFSGLSLSFFYPKKTVSGSQGSGGRGLGEGLDGRRTWRRSSWTGRRSSRAGRGSSCPSGSSTGGRSSLPYPSRPRTRRIGRRSLAGRILRCRNVSSLTLSTVSDSSSECSLSSARLALTPVDPYLKEMFWWKQSSGKTEELKAYIVEFVVESASIADGFTIRVSTPKSCCRCRAICARRSLSLGWGLKKGTVLKCIVELSFNDCFICG